MLPGTYNPPPPDVRTFAYVDVAYASGAGAANITIPATARAGDLAILLDIAVSGSTPADVIPSGWLGIGTAATDAFGRTRSSYKVLGAADPGSVITGMSGASGGEKTLIVFRPDGAIRSVTFGSYAGQTTTSDPTLQTVAASGQVAPLAVVAQATGTSAAFSTASPAFDATLAGPGAFSISGYKLYSSSPASHNVDMNDLGYNSLQSFWIAAQ